MKVPTKKGVATQAKSRGTGQGSAATAPSRDQLALHQQLSCGGRGQEPRSSASEELEWLVR